MIWVAETQLKLRSDEKESDSGSFKMLLAEQIFG